MLPKDLLIVIRRQGKIRPKYLKSAGHAEKVIALYTKALNTTYKTIQQGLKNLEHGNSDYKIIRALAQLMERRCQFSSNTTLDPQQVREFLFSEGFVINEEARNKILLKAANTFTTNIKEIEKAMFADLPQEQVLKTCDSPEPFELIEQYNLSQTQTLLFNALELEFTPGGNFQHIFRAINYFGLMYETDGISIKVSGPVSIFSKTRKYGTRLAKLVPYIINTEKWELKAKIEMSWGEERRVYDFHLTSYDGVLFPKREWDLKEFDSEVEERFYNEFKTFLPNWEIKREPTFIKAGNYVVIPDFGFYRYDIKVFMEVVGFWTPSYLKKKIEKLNVAEEDVIVAVNRNLKCSKEDFPGTVIFYEKKIPIKPFITMLRALEQKHIQSQLESLDPIQLQGDIIDMKKKAREMNISLEAFKQMNFSNYKMTGSKLLSTNFLEKLKLEIGSKRDITEIKQILQTYDLDINVLTLLGFKIIWEGLSPQKVVKGS